MVTGEWPERPGEIGGQSYSQGAGIRGNQGLDSTVFFFYLTKIAASLSQEICETLNENTVHVETT